MFPDGLIVRMERAEDPRAGWSEAAMEMKDRDEGGLLDDPVPTVFDDSEWEWK